MRSRSWRWLKVRILGLMDVPESRLRRMLHPAKDAEPKEGGDQWR